MSRQRRAVFSCLFSLLLLITLAPPAVLKRIRKGPQSLIGDQKRALKVVKSGHNLFLTGAAGTGKSHVLRYLNKTLVRLHGKGTVYVTASTGVAGQSINGTTLHSFARIGFGKGKPKDLVKQVTNNPQLYTKWERARALIIDEVSMLDPGFFDTFDTVAHRLKKPGRPFGGLQVVVCGDFFQLPPIDCEKSGFAFQTRAWSLAMFKIVELKRVWRQDDPKFMRILDELRWGNLSVASTYALGQLQKRHKQPSAQRAASDTAEYFDIYPRNEDVRVANDKYLQTLSGRLWTFTAKVDYLRLESDEDDEDDEDSLVAKNKESNLQKLLEADKDDRIPETLNLKNGSHVMCLKNSQVILIHDPRTHKQRRTHTHIHTHTRTHTYT